MAHILSGRASSADPRTMLPIEDAGNATWPSKKNGVRALHLNRAMNEQKAGPAGGEVHAPGMADARSTHGVRGRTSTQTRAAISPASQALDIVTGDEARWRHATHFVAPAQARGDTQGETPSCELVVDRDRAAAVALAVGRASGLSAREMQVIAAAARGKCTKEIAIELGLSGKTVEYFWARIFKKLACRSQMQVMSLLIAHAARQSPRDSLPA